jgi:hypothetical protein
VSDICYAISVSNIGWTLSLEDDVRTLNRVGGTKLYSVTVLLDKELAIGLKAYLQKTEQRESVFIRSLIQDNLPKLMLNADEAAPKNMDVEGEAHG